MGFILLCKQLMERKQRECDVVSALSSQREWFDIKWLHWFPFRQLLVNLKLILPPIVVHLLWIAYTAYFVMRIQLFKCGVHCFKHLEYAGSIAFRASPTASWVRLDHHCLFLQRRKVGLTWVDCLTHVHAAEWGGEKGLEPRTLNVRILPGICCVCPAPLHLQCPPHKLPRWQSEGKSKSQYPCCPCPEGTGNACKLDEKSLGSSSSPLPWEAWISWPFWASVSSYLTWRWWSLPCLLNQVTIKWKPRQCENANGIRYGATSA